MSAGNLIFGFAPPPDGQSGLFQFLPFVLVLAVFYFLVFGPMRKKQKKHAEMVQNLKAGDRVITNGGIYGTVVGVGEHVLQLRVADQVKIEVARHAIAALQGAEER